MTPALVPCLKLVMKKISALSDDLEKNDEVQGRLIPLLGVFTTLMTQMQGDQTAKGPYEWVKKFAEQFGSEDPAICRPVVKLTFLANLKLHFSESLCPRTARQIHCIYGNLDTTREVEVSKTYGFLSEETTEVVLPILVDHMDASVEYADQAITWLKALLSSTSKQVDVSKAELAVTEQIAKMVSPSMELTNTALPVGAIADTTLKFLSKLYRVLGKQFNTNNA